MQNHACENEVIVDRYHKLSLTTQIKIDDMTLDNSHFSCYWYHLYYDLCHMKHVKVALTTMYLYK